MTAVIYARYSSDNQREESIEGQIRECTAYAEKNGITVVKHYIDRALSAKTDNRPDFQQMIKDSEKRLFDIVLVWKLDRFARNRYDSAHYEYQLERNHVKLVSATEPISDSPAGIMVKSMLTGMAEYYSAELSEKVVRGMTENVLKGKYNGGTVPIGFEVDKEKFFQVDPLKAPFVVEAFQRYNEGATMKELMNWLNDSGVTTNRNQKFTYNSVQTLLTNKRYIGENHFKDIVMPDSIPAIVDKDLFEEVQQKIKKNSRAPARHKAEDDYLLTTKLFCGMCGAMMFGECGTGRNKVVHHYYKCATAKRFKTCKKKPLTLIVARDDARELADRLLPLEQPVVHRPHGGEKMVFAVLGANGLSTLALLALALRQSRPYAPDAQTLAFAHLSHLAAFAARWLPMGTAWMLVATGWLFCISLARSAAQVAHYTVWRTDAQLGSRGGLLHRYEMRLCRAHLNYADLRRSPVTRALHYCPVFVTAGSCAPELPLFVWKEGTPLLQELLPGVALPPDTAPDITRRSKIYFLPAGLPLGLCLLLTAVSSTTLPTLTLPLLVLDLFFAALLAAAFVGYRREGAWMQNDHLTLRRQKGFHLHCVCALHPDLCLTVQQSPWAVAAHRANLTLIFPGRLKQKVRSVALTELAFLQQAER